MRAKFKVIAVTTHESDITSRIVKLRCEHDGSIPEDGQLPIAAPSGYIEILINDPAAIEELELGRSFYVDFIPLKNEETNRV